jgi:hypothetical protein
MQPVAPMSPTLTLVTFAPTRVTRPTISWPGTQAYWVPGHSLRAVCTSEWQTPQKRISISTSVGPGSRRGMLIGERGLAAAEVPKARAVVGMERKKTCRVGLGSPDASKRSPFTSVLRNPYSILCPHPFAFSRSALAMSETQLRLMAAAAIIGESVQPVKGARTPAASGMPRML